MKNKQSFTTRIIHGTISGLLCAILVVPVRADAFADWIACLTTCQTDYAVAVDTCNITKQDADNATEIAADICKGACNRAKNLGDSDCTDIRIAAEAAADAQLATDLVACLIPWTAAYAAAAALTDPETIDAIKAAADAALAACQNAANQTKTDAYAAAAAADAACFAAVLTVHEACIAACDEVADAAFAASATQWALCVLGAEVAKANCIVACGPMPGT